MSEYRDDDGEPMKWGNEWCDRQCPPPMKAYGESRCSRCHQGPFFRVETTVDPVTHRLSSKLTQISQRDYIAALTWAIESLAPQGRTTGLVDLERLREYLESRCALYTAEPAGSDTAPRFPAWAAEMTKDARRVELVGDPEDMG